MSTLAARRNPWASEIRAFLSIGVPLGLTQLIQFSTNTVDVVMIGWLGAEPLAASSIAQVFYYSVYIIGYGAVIAVSPMVSQALGADPDNRDDVRLSVRMGFWCAALFMPAALIVFANAEPIALALGQNADLAAMAAPYVLTLAPGLLFTYATIILRNVLAALDRTRVPLALIALTTVLNGLLNYALIYGNWGAPRLELVGAGIATSLANAIGFFMLMAYVYWEPVSRRFHLFRDFFTPQWTRFKEIIRLGLPIGASMIFEITLFNAAVFLMGRIGANEVAAYQVALNVAAIAFMLPLGLSMAGNVRVGLAAGAHDWSRVRRASVTTLIASVTAIALVAIPCLMMPDTIAALYLDDSKETNTVVLAMVAAFLPIAGAFALFDAIQVSAIQCLRGLKDVRIPMIMTGISYWLIGFPVSYFLGLHTELGAVGVWWGLLAGLAAASVMLGTRLWWLTRRPA